MVMKIPTVRISEKNYKNLLELKAEAQKRVGHVISLSWVLEHIIIEYLDKVYDNLEFFKK
jgi:hypothetical protein